MFASGPIMNIWETEEVAKSKEFLTKLTRYYLIICLPIVVGLSVLARQVIDILTAQEYYQGFRIVPLLLLVDFSWGCNNDFTRVYFFIKTNVIMVGILPLAC